MSKLNEFHNKNKIESDPGMSLARVKLAFLF